MPLVIPYDKIDPIPIWDLEKTNREYPIYVTGESIPRGYANQVEWSFRMALRDVSRLPESIFFMITDDNCRPHLQKCSYVSRTLEFAQPDIIKIRFFVHAYGRNSIPIPNLIENNFYSSSRPERTEYSTIQNYTWSSSGSINSSWSI